MRRGAPAASGHPAPKKIPFYRRKDDPSPASGSAALASDGAVTGTVTGTGTGAAMGAAGAEQTGLCAGAGSSRGIPRKERRLISFTRSEKAAADRKSVV